jgi:hypothetical protein
VLSEYREMGAAGKTKYWNFPECWFPRWVQELLALSGDEQLGVPGVHLVPRLNMSGAELLHFLCAFKASIGAAFVYFILRTH